MISSLGVGQKMPKGAKTKEQMCFIGPFCCRPGKPRRAGTGESFPCEAGQGEDSCVLLSLVPGVWLRALQKQCPW